MVRLTKLTIDRLRNVKPTELEFGTTFNVLLGKNATGKSTLLDLIAAVTNNDLSRYADGEYELGWEIEHGTTRLEAKVAHRRPDGWTEGEAATDPLKGIRGPDFVDSYDLHVRIGETEPTRLRVEGSDGWWTPPGGVETKFSVERLLRPSIGAGLGAALALSGQPPDAALLNAVPLIAPADHLERFDEALGGFSHITDGAFSWIEREGTLGVRVGDPGGWMMPGLFPPGSLDGPVGFDTLPLLAEIPALLGFTSATIQGRLARKTSEGERTVREFGGFAFYFHKSDGSVVGQDWLSFGQKRLFAFLWYLAVRRDRPVIADELMNGLHHEWIRLCVERLRDRQSFLATQHPYLLDHVPIRSDDPTPGLVDAKRSFIRCTVEHDERGREQLSWRNFTPPEAERFVKAHRAGIQLVSEILSTEGLW